MIFLFLLLSYWINLACWDRPQSAYRTVRCCFRAHQAANGGVSFNTFLQDTSVCPCFTIGGFKGRGQPRGRGLLTLWGADRDEHIGFSGYWTCCLLLIRQTLKSNTQKPVVLFVFKALGLNRKDLSIKATRCEGISSRGVRWTNPLQLCPFLKPQKTSRARVFFFWALKYSRSISNNL